MMIPVDPNQKKDAPNNKLYYPARPDMLNIPCQLIYRESGGAAQIEKNERRSHQK